MSLVTVLKCIPAGDPGSPRSFAGSEDPGPRRVVLSALAATREAMLNALARGDSGLRASIGAGRPGRRRLRLRAPSSTGASPAHGTGGGGLRCHSQPRQPQAGRDDGVTAGPLLQTPRGDSGSLKVGAHPHPACEQRPSYFSKLLSLACALRDLCNPRPWNILSSG